MRTPPFTQTKDTLGQELRKIQEEIAKEKVNFELLHRQAQEEGAWITSVRKDAEGKLMDAFHTIMKSKKKTTDIEVELKAVDLQIFKLATKISLQQSTIERNADILKKQKEENEKKKKELSDRKQEVKNEIKELDKLKIEKKELSDKLIKTKSEIESKIKEKQKVINEIVFKKIEMEKEMNKLQEYKQILEKRGRDLEIYKGRIQREFEKVFPGHKFIIL